MLGIRVERLRRGLSQMQLSLLTGISAQDISAIENGRRRPGSGWRRRLAGALGVPEDRLLERVDGGPDGSPSRVLDVGQ